MSEWSRYRVNGTALEVAARVPAHARHPAVVLVPATGATASDWDAIGAALSQDRAVFAVDLRGHGRSDWPGRYSIDLMADDLTELLPRLAPSLDVIGHSLGGLVAARSLARHPHLARRLVLEDVGVPRPRPAAMPERPEGDLDFDWAVVEQVRPEIDTPAAHWPSTLAAVVNPTLVIGGGPGSFVPRAHVAELAGLVADGHHTTIEGGHQIHSTQPERFLSTVRAFLDA